MICELNLFNLPRNLLFDLWFVISFKGFWWIDWLWYKLLTILCLFLQKQQLRTVFKHFIQFQEINYFEVSISSSLVETFDHSIHKNPETIDFLPLSCSTGSWISFELELPTNCSIKILKEKWTLYPMPLSNPFYPIYATPKISHRVIASQRNSKTQCHMSQASTSLVASSET